MISAVHVSRDGNRVVSGSWDRSIKIWNVKTKMCEITRHGHAGPVSCVAISGDNSVVISGSLDVDGPSSVNVWTVDGDIVRTFVGHIGQLGLFGNSISLFICLFSCPLRITYRRCRILHRNISR